MGLFTAGQQAPLLPTFGPVSTPIPHKNERITLAGATFETRVYPSSEQASQTILAFHGYGRPLEDFEIFLPLLKSHQKLVSVSLFGHGFSKVPGSYSDKQAISLPDFTVWMEALIDHYATGSTHMLTYSMGGRIALKTAELLPHKVDSLLLTAPDGFRQPWIYNPIFGSKAGRWLYGKTEKRPSWVFAVVRFLTFFKLLHPKAEKFVAVHFGSAEKRKRLREVWTRYRTINPDLEKLGELVDAGDLQMKLIFGAHDIVIPTALGTAFQKSITTPVLHEIPGGHQLLTPSLTDYIQEQELWF